MIQKDSTTLHTAATLAVRVAVKTDMSHQNDTIIVFFFAAYKNKTMLKLLWSFLIFSLRISGLIRRGTAYSAQNKTIIILPDDARRTTSRLPAVSDACDPFWHQIRSLESNLFFFLFFTLYNLGTVNPICAYLMPCLVRQWLFSWYLSNPWDSCMHLANTYFKKCLAVSSDVKILLRWLSSSHILNSFGIYWQFRYRIKWDHKRRDDWLMHYLFLNWVCLMFALLSFTGDPSMATNSGFLAFVLISNIILHQF